MSKIMNMVCAVGILVVIGLWCIVLYVIKADGVVITKNASYVCNDSFIHNLTDFDTIITPYDEVTVNDVAKIIYKYFGNSRTVDVNDYTDELFIDFANALAEYFNIQTTYEFKMSTDKDYYNSSTGTTLGYYLSSKDDIVLRGDTIFDSQNILNSDIRINSEITIPASSISQRQMEIPFDTIVSVILHETRHAYQHYCVDKYYREHGFNNYQLLAIKHSIINYKDIDHYGYEEYSNNLIERDARMFADICMSKYEEEYRR